MKPKFFSTIAPQFNGGAVSYKLSNLSHNVKNVAPENRTFNVSNISYNSISSELDIDKIVLDMTTKFNEAIKSCGEGMHY